MDTSPELKLVSLFQWPLVYSNKQVHSACGPAFSGLPLHQTYRPSSHANVVQKRYPALKTWQSVKKRLCLVFEAINVTEDFKRKTQDWQSKDE